MQSEIYTSTGGFVVYRDPRLTPSDEDLASLSEEQQRVVKDVLLQKNVLMHGRAGTGKSMTLERIMRVLSSYDKVCVLTAFTGAAAINIGGMTIHSFFKGMGLMNDDIEALKRKLKRNAFLKSKIRGLDVFIIDEISMVSATFFDKLDRLFRYATGIDSAFGGKQLLCSGDFFQLPPIERNALGAVYAFEAEVWDQLHINVIEFECVFRQQDPLFVKLLDRVRIGELDITGMKILLTRLNAEIACDGIIPSSLFARNDDANNVNLRELRRLESDEFIFESSCVVQPLKTACDTDVKELYRLSIDIRKHAPVPDTLHLRKGAQVMLRWNMDLSKGLANGSRGVVIGFQGEHDTPVVQFMNGVYKTIYKHNFEYKYKTGTITFTQIPLLLAWAMTIHKSLGATMDLVAISMRNISTPGQAYVALSRVRSLEGLSLLDFNPMCVKADTRVLSAFPPPLMADMELDVNESNKEGEEMYKQPKEEQQGQPRET
jgi:ATP-dependent DNA helicase PIF1